MNEYLRKFLHRGLVFSGLGPIVLGIVYLALSLTIDNFNLSGADVLVGIVSTYLIAFVQAGASVFNQIESWSVGKSALIHFGVIYAVYVISYLVNSWIPFEWTVIGIFTVIFVVAYLVTWLTVYFIVRKTSREFNKKLLGS